MRSTRPPSTQLQLYAGLLAARMEDAAGVADALRRTQGSGAIRDFPTLAQLRQVVLAEQERLSGKPQAAVARLRPIVKRDDALVAAHWALMRAQQAAGDATGAKTQAHWLATHRGRVFAEATTTDVLRFFNVAVSAEAMQGEKARAATANATGSAGRTDRLRAADLKSGLDPADALPGRTPEATSPQPPSCASKGHSMPLDADHHVFQLVALRLDLFRRCQLAALQLHAVHGSQ